MREKRYDVIFWDVDGTLLDFAKSERWALTETFREYGMEIDEEIISLYSSINDSFWKRLELGQITREQVFHGRFKELFAQFLPGGALVREHIDAARLQEIDVAEFHLKFRHHLGSVYFYLDDSIALCKKLKEEGFLQYVITNGAEWPQRNKLHLSGFDAVMDDIFISEVIGYNKPDLRFFEACFEKIKAVRGEEEAIWNRERILVVGDSMTSDMKGAQNAGLDSCHYAPKLEGNLKQNGVTWQIAHLWDLEGILWQNQKVRK